MFSLIKSIIWLVGFVVISLFVLDYFGYEINRNYFNESKKKCLEELKQCQQEYIRQGIDNARCNFNCVDPKLILNTKKNISQERQHQETQKNIQEKDTNQSQENSTNSTDSTESQ